MSLELHIAEQDRHLSSATVLVRWTVSKSTLRALERAGLSKKALVVLATAPDGVVGSCALELRKVVPLSDQMAHVRFARPGKNRIFAIVVPELCAMGGSRDIFLSRLRGGWNSSVATENGVLPDWILGSKENDRFYYHGLHQPGAVLEVDVPEECFAKPPPVWAKKVVGLFFRDRPADQCDFRRQFIIAALLTLFWLPIWQTLKAAWYLATLAPLLVFVGFRIILLGQYPIGTRWRDLFTRQFLREPWYRFNEWSTKCVKDWKSVWFSPPYLPKVWGNATVFFTPIFPAIFSVISFLSSLEKEKSPSWISCLFGAYVFCGITAAIVAFCILFVKAVFSAWDVYERKTARKVEKTVKDGEALVPKTLQRPYDPALAVLVGPTTGGCPVDVSVAANRVTAIKLRAQELIGKVCRPFAH